MSFSPVVVPPCLPFQILCYALANQSFPTTFIVCSTRSSFLDALLEDITSKDPSPHAELNINAAPEGQYHALNESMGESERPSHQAELKIHTLLKPTLHQIATSRHLTTVFIHTVSHLRAYLSVFPADLPGSVQLPPAQQFEKPGSKAPLLLVYGLVALHKDTSEWSVQGLGTTVAALVEAGNRAGVRVVLVEGNDTIKNSSSASVDRPRAASESDGLELSETQRIESERKAGKRIWTERLPMLNGSARRIGFESGDGGWGGRTVDVRSVLKRWFIFRDMVWDC